MVEIGCYRKGFIKNGFKKNKKKYELDVMVQINNPISEEGFRTGVIADLSGISTQTQELLINFPNSVVK